MTTDEWQAYTAWRNAVVAGYLQVPFVRGTQVSDSGQVTSQVEYEDIGIILDVEPHIRQAA